MIELKPCPFCGGKAEFETKYSPTFNPDGASVYCKECRASSEFVGISMDYSCKEKAAELWNKRVGEEK